MSEFCEHETFKDICGICHRDTQITALRAEVASKNEQFQQYARKMETDIDALAAQNEKLRAALEKLSCKCPSNCDWEKYGDICPSWVARAALEENTND